MDLSARNRSRIENEIIPALGVLHEKTPGPVALNELPIWGSLTKSDKIKIGRHFRKIVEAGQVDGIKFAGKRKDSHSTYMPAGMGKGIGGLIRGLFG